MRPKRFFYVLFLLGALLVLLTGAGPAGAGFRGANGKLAFENFRDGNAEIYVTNADGTGQARLTENPAFDGLPAWSADGTKLVFSSDRDGDFEIFSMNADGSGQTQLTHNDAQDSPGPFAGAGWSPDGTKIVFSTDRDGNFELYTMNADGSDQTRLTNNDALDVNPSWSPDGRQI